MKWLVTSFPGISCKVPSLFFFSRDPKPTLLFCSLDWDRRPVFHVIRDADDFDPFLAGLIFGSERRFEALAERGLAAPELFSHRAADDGDAPARSCSLKTRPSKIAMRKVLK
jgi:hypothetical protein